MTATPVYPQTIKNGQVQVLPADTTSLKTVYTAGTNGSKIESIILSTTDTSARDYQFYVTISGTDYLLGTLSLPANSGFTNSVPHVAVFNHTQFAGLSMDANGNKFLYLANGSVLKVKCLTTVTSAKATSVFTQAADF